MRLEVVSNGLSPEKHAVAVAVAAIARPFVVDGSDQLVPRNITLKEVARATDGMEVGNISEAIGEKQRLGGLGYVNCIVFSDSEGQTWRVEQGTSTHHTRIKKAARMAGLRSSKDGVKDGKATFKSMRTAFETRSTRVLLSMGLPEPEDIKMDKPPKANSQRWTNRAKAKIHEANRMGWDILRANWVDPQELEYQDRLNKAKLLGVL